MQLVPIASTQVSYSANNAGGKPQSAYLDDRYIGSTYQDPPSIPNTPRGPSAQDYPANPASTNMPSSTMPSFGSWLNSSYGLNPANTNMLSNNMPSFGKQLNSSYALNPANTNMPSNLMPSFGARLNSAHALNPANTNMSSDLMPSFGGLFQMPPKPPTSGQPSQASLPKSEQAPLAWKGYTRFASSTSTLDSQRDMNGLVWHGSGPHPPGSEVDLKFQEDSGSKSGSGGSSPSTGSSAAGSAPKPSGVSPAGSPGGSQAGSSQGGGGKSGGKLFMIC